MPRCSARTPKRTQKGILQMIALQDTRTINLKEAAQGGEQKEKGRQ
jgi:hypothetical protein